MTLAIPPDPMSAVLADLARVTAERDALAAALATLRDAADAVVSARGSIEVGFMLDADLDRLTDAIASTPTDLAAAHDARDADHGLAEPPTGGCFRWGLCEPPGGEKLDGRERGER